MQIPVIVEAIANDGYCAKSGEPLPASAKGTTPEEALANLRQLLDGQCRSGKQLFALEMPAKNNPWLAMAGMYDPHDPVVQEWKKAMATYRQEAENDPDYP